MTHPHPLPGGEQEGWVQQPVRCQPASELRLGCFPAPNSRGGCQNQSIDAPIVSLPTVNFFELRVASGIEAIRKYFHL